MSILIKSAIIVDSKSNFNFKKKDILIKNGVIVDIADSTIMSDIFALSFFHPCWAGQ